MRRIDTLTQDELIAELVDAIDVVRIAHPLYGSPPSARKRLRRLIKENPTSVRRPRVLHNIGKARAEWLAPLVEAELSTT